MEIYLCNDKGEFVKKAEARKDPEEKGRYLIPRNAVKEKPPKITEGEKAVYKNNKWNIEEDEFYLREKQQEERENELREKKKNLKEQYIQTKSNMTVEEKFEIIEELLDLK
jgi:hypothetical protein